MKDFISSLTEYFTNFSFGNVLEILFVASLLFFGLIFIKRYKAVGFLYGLFAITIMGIVARILNLIVFLDLYYFFYIGQFVLFIYIHGDEIKRDIQIQNISRQMVENKTSYHGSPEEIEDFIEQIIKACQSMSKKNIGALIIVVPTSIPIQISESGVAIDGNITKQLIESTFFPNSPMHDGALLIKNGKILAAGCLLPLSQDLRLPKELGTRHRAGIGISETTSVLSIIISEETGIISLARGGKLVRYADSEILNSALRVIFGLSLDDGGLFK